VRQSRAPVDPAPPEDPRLLLSFPLLASPFLLQSRGWGVVSRTSLFFGETSSAAPPTPWKPRRVPPPLHFHPTSFPTGAMILHPLSGQERPLYRQGGGGPSFQGGHRGGSTFSSSSFLYPIFLIPKKTRGMRPILNLKKLNAAHLDTPYFRMEMVEDMRHALRPGDWAASIDLRDAYFHVPLHPSTRKYMRFEWRGRLFQFCVLPFGLSPGLHVFMSLIQFIKVNLG
jgi:hypothetical protein